MYVVESKTHTCFQGDDMLHEIYYNIGVVEVCKEFYIQIAFTKFILKLQFNTKC